MLLFLRTCQNTFKLKLLPYKFAHVVYTVMLDISIFAYSEVVSIYIAHPVMKSSFPQCWVSTALFFTFPWSRDCTGICLSMILWEVDGSVPVEKFGLFPVVISWLTGNAADVYGLYAATYSPASTPRCRHVVYMWHICWGVRNVNATFLHVN